jgi:hypothetical protein
MLSELRQKQDIFSLWEERLESGFPIAKINSLEAAYLLTLDSSRAETRE